MDSRSFWLGYFVAILITSSTTLFISNLVLENSAKKGYMKLPSGIYTMEFYHLTETPERKD